MAVWEIELETNTIHSDADLSNLKQDTPINYPDYALCLPNYSIIGSTVQNVDTIDSGNIGYVSGVMSDENGAFETPPVISMTFARNKTSNGLNMIFNTLTNDYCTDLTIQYYKHNDLVAEIDYAPNSAEYFCEARIGTFNKVVITFYKTNKPFRYLWLAQLDNERLTKADGLRIEYNDTAYQAKQDMTINTSVLDPRSDLSTLYEEESFISHPEYAAALPNYSLLDGTYINAPNEYENMGFISNEISNENGEFVNDIPFIAFTFGHYITSIGLHLYQNNISNDYADEITVYWSRDNEILDSKTYTLDSYNYFLNNRVENYNRVMIFFDHTNKPYRPVFLQGIAFGFFKVFDETEITSATIFNQVSLLGDSQPISTLEFNILALSDINFEFERYQRTRVTFDKQVIGRFYLTKGEKKAKNRFYFKSENVITMLDDFKHKGGLYNNVLASEIIEEIFANTGQKVIIDSDLENATITGWLPYSTCRKNLAQICFAIGAVVDTSFDENVYIYKYDSTLTPTVIRDEFIYKDSIKLKRGDIISGTALTVHGYTPNTTDEAKEIYGDILTGETTVEFKEPYHSLTIENGTIQDSGDNYAVIVGTGAKVSLKGKTYTHSEEILLKENEYITRNKKNVEVKDATLVNSSNASEVLNRMYNYYLNNMELTGNIVLNEVQLSDIVTLNTFDGDRTGIINALKLQFYGEIKAGATLKCI